MHAHTPFAMLAFASSAQLSTVCLFRRFVSFSHRVCTHKAKQKQQQKKGNNCCVAYYNNSYTTANSKGHQGEGEKKKKKRFAWDDGPGARRKVLILLFFIINMYAVAAFPLSSSTFACTLIIICKHTLPCVYLNMCVCVCVHIHK